MSCFVRTSVSNLFTKYSIACKKVSDLMLHTLTQFHAHLCTCRSEHWCQHDLLHGTCDHNTTSMKD